MDDTLSTLQGRVSLSWEHGDADARFNREAHGWFWTVYDRAKRQIAACGHARSIEDALAAVGLVFGEK